MKSYRASGGMQYWKGSDYTPALCLRNWICSPAPERDASVRRRDLLVYVPPPPRRDAGAQVFKKDRAQRNTRTLVTHRLDCVRA